MCPFLFILILTYLSSCHIVLDTPTAAPPTTPSFTWEILRDYTDKVEINWKPDMNGNPGSCFRVVYRINGRIDWNETNPIINAMSTIIDGLHSETEYEMAVVSIDGEYSTQSDAQIIKTSRYPSYPGMIPDSLIWGIYITVFVILLVVVIFISICCYCLFLANKKELL